jgi:hypothetical protein
MLYVNAFVCHAGMYNFLTHTLTGFLVSKILIHDICDWLLSL